jgi:NAD(P)-dependent dehydrogenase (short-subunit alcohol dehydrogenase family)
MDLGLAGRTALVVGASRGIGWAVAECLAAEGARVAGIARRPEIAQVPWGLGVAVDVTRPVMMDEALAAIEASMGPPTLLVWSVAALFDHQKLHTLPESAWREWLEADLVAAMRIISRLLPGMMRAHHGRIVVLSSLAATMGLPGASAYGVGKAGLEGLVHSLAVDYSRYGITANALRLGFVKTERTDDRHADPGALSAHTAVKRLTTPREVAAAVAFLCSDQAGTITGATLPMTGGVELAVR